MNLVHSKDDLLQLQVERFWRSDFSDCLAESRVSMSLEDKQALEIMKETVTFVKSRYQIGLPWKRRPPLISSNRSLAESRLDQLKRRLLKNEDLLVKYNTTMNEYLSKGHAAKLTSGELLPNEGKFVWYLPHHPVFHPRKPGKVRVVFDCAAKSLGVSLNDMLLQGPDLNNNLIGVLMRFREEPVAVVADIESMFHQVRVDPEDCDALRFLWWPSGDLSRSPEEYKRVVHVFGVTSSPGCTGFCLLKTAEDNQNELLSRGGFRLTKWISNDCEVVESIPQSERAASVVDLALDEIPVERTLGIQWNVGADKFCFKVVAKEKPLTRRGVLSVASSLYDPLRFVAPFTLSAKMILQELCQKKLGWDERIDGEELKRWKDWLADLPRLS